MKVTGYMLIVNEALTGFDKKGSVRKECKADNPTLIVLRNRT